MAEKLTETHKRNISAGRQRQLERKRLGLPPENFSIHRPRGRSDPDAALRKFD